jgi:protein O-mannosyl-transferase
MIKRIYLVLNRLIINMVTNPNLNWRYVLLLFIIAILVYLPGLPGGFIYDDHYNFLQNTAINNSELSFSAAWSATLSGTSGPLGRPIAMLSFYLNHQLSGFSPISYKIFNIAIHAINTLLVFFIVCRLLNLFVNLGYLSRGKYNSEHLAFWITILWAIHPINLTAVLYVVQRMTSMSAMFTLLGIYFYCNLRETSIPDVKRMIIKLSFVILFGIIAALCKENGLLLFLFLFVIECFLFQWRVHTLQEGWGLKIFYIFVLVIPLCFAGVMLLNGDLTANYSSRTFTLTQRMLTEFRVLWFYIFQIILPQANLFGLFHDDFLLSTSLIDPVSTAWSIIAFILLILFTVRCTRKFRWFGFGLLFFFAGHLMESTILPLNLVHEHRNYLPSLGLIIVFVLSLNLIINKIKVIRSNILFVIITLLFTSITVSRAYDWSNVVLLGERLAQRHPDSVTANYEMGYAYSKVYEQTHDPVFAYTAINALQRAESLSDSEMQPAIALVHVRAMLGEVEDQALIDKIAMDFRHGKVSIKEVISLRQLVNCQAEGICNVSDIIMQVIFNALMNNHGLVGRLSDDVLYIYSTYLMTIPDGAAKALTIILDIVSRNPNTLEYQVKLVSVLLTNKKYEEAKLLMDTLARSHGIKWNIVDK